MAGESLSTNNKLDCLLGDFSEKESHLCSHMLKKNSKAKISLTFLRF